VGNLDANDSLNPTALGLDDETSMTTPSKVCPVISLLLLLMGADVSATDLLYDNGPDAFSFSTTNLISFSPGPPGPTGQLVTNYVTDEFTLSAPATITGVVFSETTVTPSGHLGSPPIFVNYSFGTSPFGTEAMGPNTGGGTGAIGSFQTRSSGSLQNWISDFGVGNIFLPAGTYWLTLDAAIDINNAVDHINGDWWAVTNATSGDAMFRSIDSTGATSTGELNNEPSFQIYGFIGSPPVPGLPEPGTWGLLVLGLLALALLKTSFAGTLLSARVTSKRTRRSISTRP
jgi:hypothetical protein